MQVRNVWLREGSRNHRTTMADGLHVLEQDAYFGADDTARLAIGGMELPDKRTVWLVALIFENGSSETRAIVPLRTAAGVSAVEERASRTSVSIERLTDATVDYNGVVLTTDGRRLRAVEFEPATLPYSLSDLNQKIIHATLAITPGAGRCYRDLRDDLPPEMRANIPPLRILDFSTLIQATGQPPFQIPLLKQIQGEFGKRHPSEKIPSPQAIANVLATCGVRLPRARRQ